MFILHRKERILELWTLQDESLQIIAQLTVAGTQDPQNVHILDRDNDYYLIVVEYEGRFQLELYPYNFSPGKQLETTEMQFQQLYTLSDIFYDKSALRAPEIIIKGNKDYIIFASSHGWMHVAKRIPDQFNYEFITPVMKPNIYKNASEIYHHEGCDNLLFKTSYIVIVNNDMPSLSFLYPCRVLEVQTVRWECSLRKQIQVYLQLF